MMKILNRKEFLALENDVLFSKYEPCSFQNICIKHQTLPSNDFVYQQIVDAIESESSDDWANKLFNAEKEGISVAMDFNFAGRDGCFDDEQLFAVWENADVLALIEKLKTLVTAK
jgi:hypothetical protein